MRTIMSKGLEVRGFGGAMVGGTAALEQLGTWVRDGRIRHPEVIVDGLNAAPAAFAGIFDGNRNVDKLLVSVAEPRSEEHTSELQSLMRIPYAVVFLKKTTSET